MPPLNSLFYTKLLTEVIIYKLTSLDTGLLLPVYFLFCQTCFSGMIECDDLVLPLGNTTRVEIYLISDK